MRNSTKIKVVGVGGAGSNAISRMKQCKIKGVDLIAINTDAQDLKKTKADLKLRIGKKLTRGLGSGMNPLIGLKAAQESENEIREVLKDSDMVFITAGLGGGSGTGASPVVAQIAKEIGALTIAVVTKPFSFEGLKRKYIAIRGLKKLKDKVDSLLIIPNDKLLKLKNKNISLSSAFWICDEVLRQAVQGISDLINISGIINVDFADVKSIMQNSGPALFGIGKAKGKNRAQEAAMKAIHSPLIDFSIKGAKGILFNVFGDSSLSLSEINEAAKVITGNVHPQAKIIFGAVQKEKIKNKTLEITVIATDFDDKV